MLYLAYCFWNLPLAVQIQGEFIGGKFDVGPDQGRSRCMLGSTTDLVKHPAISAVHLSRYVLIIYLRLVCFILYLDGATHLD